MTKRKRPQIDNFAAGVSGIRPRGRPTKEQEPLRGFEGALSGKKKR
jgi:hypothetical protein